MWKALIPSLLTAGNTFLGFLSIYYSFIHEFGIAGVLIFYATVLDLFDGRLARILNTSDNIGKEMDSFADFLSFGVAPALMFTNLLTDFFIEQNLSVILLYCIAFIYVLCASIRLALFNNISENSYMGRVKKNDPSDFVGMPSTFMGGILAFFMGFSGFANGFFGHYIPTFQVPVWFFIVLILVGSACLLIPVPFPKIGRKFFQFRRYPVLNYTIIFFLFLICRWALLVMSVLYVVLPLVFFVFRRRRI